MENVVTLSMPVGILGKAAEVVCETKEQHTKLEAQNHFPDTREQVEKVFGTQGVEEWQNLLEKINLDKRSVSQKAVEKIAELQSEYQKAIDEQTIPQGKDIIEENSGDFRLLENGIIQTSYALARLIEQHNNPAFRAMATKYARERGWDGFEFFDHEAQLREFGTDYLKLCSVACENIDGYSFLQVMNEGELDRRVRAYGLLDEYLKGR